MTISNDDKLLPEATKPLHELGTALRHIVQSMPMAAFVIEGHTDQQGTEQYNLDLSLRRARRVTEYLVTNFRLPPERLGIKGYGKTRRLSLGASEANHARNRRVEVVRLKAPALDVQASSASVQGAPAHESVFAVDVVVFQEDVESRPRKLEAGAVLRSGDGYRLYFEPHQPCYVSIFQLDASGKLFRLFPNSKYGTSNNVVQARTAYWVPGKAAWFSLDQTPGKETIYVVATRERREDIEDIITRKAQQEFNLVIKTMGIAGVRPGKSIEMSSTQGQSAPLTADEISRKGMSLAYEFTFRHE